MEIVTVPKEQIESEVTLNLIEVVKKNDKNNQLVTLLTKCQKNQPIKSKTNNSSSELSNDILITVNKNLTSAKKQLGWWGNVPRIKLASSGITAMLLGLTKGGYDLFLFSKEDNDMAENIFSILGDVVLFCGGYLALKIAWQNNSAKDEYQKAQMIKFMIQTTVSSLQKSDIGEKDLLDELEQE